MPDFYAEAKNLFAYTQALRRDLHVHPELGFKEVRTAGIVAKELSNLGLEVTTGVAETGVVALLEGAKPGPVILLRFDMDALPVLEETGVDYASQTPGVMHACGHDGHVAIGLTVARMLNAVRQDLRGSLKFVFQPAEEGLGGAERMVAAGVLSSPAPATTLAMHLWNEKPVGWVALVPGPMMAGAALFSIVITGVGGHGAAPQQVVDPVVAAAQLVMALQTIVSRNLAPMQSAVLSTTYLRAGETYNVIPPTVELRGTIRYFEQNVKEKIYKRMDELAAQIAGAFNCSAEVKITDLTSAVVNASSVTGRLQGLAGKVLPDVKIDASYQTMISEDMALMMDRVPGCYVLVGSANPEKGLNYGHHHPKFNFDEDALPRGAALMAAAAYDLLQ